MNTSGPPVDWEQVLDLVEDIKPGADLIFDAWNSGYGTPDFNGALGVQSLIGDRIQVACEAIGQVADADVAADASVEADPDELDAWARALWPDCGGYLRLGSVTRGLVRNVVAHHRRIVSGALPEGARLPEVSVDPDDPYRVDVGGRSYHVQGLTADSAESWALDLLALAAYLRAVQDRRDRDAARDLDRRSAEMVATAYGARNPDPDAVWAELSEAERGVVRALVAAGARLPDQPTGPTPDSRPAR